MPRRTKLYIGPGQALVDGGRPDVASADAGRPATILQKVDVDVTALRKKIAAYIQKFDELAQVADRDRFIDDLVDECAWAKTVRLDHLTKGTRTKPNEWTSQILAGGLAKVMKQHELPVATSEYLDRKGKKRQSLYLRMIPGLGRIAGFPAPRDVKGFALRAKSIKFINHKGSGLR
jgi:hypothetical protein